MRHAWGVGGGGHFIEDRSLLWGMAGGGGRWRVCVHRVPPFVGCRWRGAGVRGGGADERPITGKCFAMNLPYINKR